ncbi:unnamed protein product [Cyclocybe aegerita]|uniref:Uncharacterized protein n=1 Tax=Cyclocybe aegerita TaxID=1973307 RepID=A0A8S0VT19_CYCAE|nr:unnamed protein product [Cyclocybe aegerita]
MQILTTIVALAVGIAGTFPSAFAKPQLSKRDEVHCGTTDDATLSDCRALIDNRDNWNAAFAGNDNLCHYTNPQDLKFNYPAYNTACRGECCVYYASGDSDEGPVPNAETIRSRAAGLLGCGDTGSNKVNALGVAGDGSGVCISNGDGCGDCFDDSDFIN